MYFLKTSVKEILEEFNEVLPVARREFGEIIYDVNQHRKETR